MQLGRVIGHATSTIKHASLEGLRLVLVQPLNAAEQADGDVQLVVDRLGAGVGTLVLLNTDGKGARELVGQEKTPARWFVAGIVDATQREGGGGGAEVRMRIGKVCGRIVLNRFQEGLAGGRFLIVEVQSAAGLSGKSGGSGERVVVYDHLGAGDGEMIAFTESREASMPFYPEKLVPLDAYNAAILDRVVVELEL